MDLADILRVSSGDALAMRHPARSAPCQTGMVVVDNDAAAKCPLDHADGKRRRFRWLGQYTPLVALAHHNAAALLAASHECFW